MLFKILIVILSLFVSTASGQTKGVYDYITYINWTPSHSGYWQQMNDGTYARSDFQWAVSRSTNMIDGYYIYDIWFVSNSYLWNYMTNTPGQWVSVKINNINVKADGDPVSSVGWVLCNESYSPSALKFISKNPNAYVRIYWSGHNIP